MTTSDSIFTSGNMRVRIMREEEGVLHPWRSHSTAGNLAQWADYWDAGSFLPAGERPFGCDRPTLETKEEMQQWIDQTRSSGQPYLIYGIHFLDKYGDLVLVKTFDIDSEYLDGAIFTNYEDCLRNVDGNPPEEKDIRTHMSEILQHEFDLLRAWATDCFFGFVVEKKCDHCGSWVAASDDSSVWGFPCLTPDMKEMYTAMAEHWDKDNADIRNIMVQMGI